MPEARFELSDARGHRVVAIDKAPFTIGRRAGNDLRLESGDISREHAEVVPGERGLLIRDRGSRFGTFVNGERVTEHALKQGDRIRLGQSRGVEMTYREAEPGERRTSSGERGSATGSELHQVSMLLEGLRALGSARVLDEVLAMVIDSAIQVSGAERGFIMLADANGRLEFKLARARGGITLPGQSFATSRKIPEQVFAEGQVRVMADLLDGDLPAYHSGTIALGIRHVFCMPLRLVRYVDFAEASPDDRQIGVLYLDSRERGKLLSGSIRAGMETLATEAAVAIENARLYREAVEKARIEEELRIAAEIQHALLPPPAWSLDYLEAEGQTIPCRAIGGDFFDYMTLLDGSSGFAVADVSGKGAPAALLTAVIQGVIGAQASSGEGPAATVSRINDVLIRRALGSRFVTIFFAALARDGNLTYCNAGHNPPFLVGRDSVRRLSTGGMICGLFPEARYEQETVLLSPGDLLVMFSDGVPEAFNLADEEFGDDRILECIREAGTAKPADILEALLTRVQEFSAGTVQRDDITAVVLRYGRPQ